MAVLSYKDLDVWQRSMDLVAKVYDLTKRFPKEETYALTGQVRRAAISVPSNIAEGRAKRSTRDFIRYIGISYGSLAELETQLMIGERLGYVSNDDLLPMLEESATIGRMLNGLIAGLEKKLSSLNTES